MRAAKPGAPVQRRQEHPTPELLHEAWCSSKRRDGWTYGPVKDPERKTHPCLVPYEELSAQQKLKDSLLLAIVATLAAEAPD